MNTFWPKYPIDIYENSVEHEGEWLHRNTETNTPRKENINT